MFCIDKGFIGYEFLLCVVCFLGKQLAIRKTLNYCIQSENEI